MKRIMNKNNGNRISMTIITLVISLIFIAGCATTSGTERNVAAAVTMVQVEEDIKVLLLELSATNSALASIVNPLQDEIETAYGIFVEGTDPLEAASEQFITQSREMSSQGRAYFAEWRIDGDTYSNPQIRELSEQLRSDLSQQYIKISESSVGIEGELREYVSNINQIQVYFSNDLTVRGITAISPIANRTILDGFELSVKLRDLLESVEIARGVLSPNSTVSYQ